MCAVSDRECFGRLAMNKLGAELDGPLVKVSMDATADSIACFENDYFQLRSAEFARRRESRCTCSDDDNVSVLLHIQPLFAKINTSKSINRGIYVALGQLTGRYLSCESSHSNCTWSHSSSLSCS